MVFPDDWRTLIATGSRHAIIVLAAFLGYLYLSPLVSPWPAVMLYGTGWIVIMAARARGVPREKAPVPACLFVTGVSLVLLAFTGIAGWIVAPPPGGRLEQMLPMAPYSLIPMSIVVPGTFLGEYLFRNRRCARMAFAPVVALAITGLLWTQAGFRTSLLGHPWQYAVAALILVVLLAVHQMAFSWGDVLPGNGHGVPVVRACREQRQRGGIPSVWVFPHLVRRGVIVAIAVVLVLGVYRHWENQAVSAGGGLLRPTLFRFDFADVVSLESEIQLSRDLILLYREDQPPGDRLLRRYVLSGYSPRRGFYRLEPHQEPSPAPPLSVREASSMAELSRFPVDTSPPAVAQEYYIVNFDPDAFIAVPEPERITLYRGSPDSSFNAAYSVVSRSVRRDGAYLGSIPWPDSLPERWHQVYVDTPVPAAVADLAREITDGLDGYYETVRALEQYLLEEYHYSLLPGDAPDGDQLSHFLFESRKGYCSYFAFSMALMARSLGIPARVAAGFFVIPEAGMLGFHPIRGDMAHAWVEIYFPGAGWVAFDPTAQTPAPGETVTLDYRIDRDQLAALVEEILAMPVPPDRRDSTPGTDHSGATLLPVFRRLAGFVHRFRYAVVMIALASAWAVRRLWWSRFRRNNPAAAAVMRFLSFRNACFLVEDEGSCFRTAPLGDTPEPLRAPGVAAARARFGPDFDERDLEDLELALQVVRHDQIRELRKGHRFLKLLLFALRTGPVPSRRYTRKRSRDAGGVPVRILVLFLVAGGLFFPGGVDGTDQLDATVVSDMDQHEARIRRAIDAENWEEALRRIDGARRLYPEEQRFPLMEGDLYYSQELFQRAAEAYREALAMGASEYSTRYLLARALARLNRNEEASSQLEMLHGRWPDDIFIAGDLAWLHFKRHRLNEAQHLLEDTLYRVGDERDLLMTLATVRASLFDYEGSLEAYNRAIESARRNDDRVFQAIAYYNRSILHANFHRWDLALESAELSLAAADRASGYMIRAELHARRMDLESVLSDYERARVLDRETPLPDLSLAAAHVMAGSPERALQLTERVMARENENWMYSYGTDPDRYQLRVYAVAADSWTAAARRDWLFRPGTSWDGIGIRLRSLYRHGMAWFYRGMMRRQAQLVARDLERQGRFLPAARQLMVATEHLPRLSERYARRAEMLELDFNPESQVDYELLRVVREKDREGLQRLVEQLDQPWRRMDRVEALRELYRLEGNRRESGLAVAGRLYAYAPGSFLTAGLTVPVSLTVEDGTVETGVSPRTVRRQLARMGFRFRDESPLQLVVEAHDGRFDYRMLYEGVPIRSGTVRVGAAGVGAVSVGAFRNTNTHESALEEMARNLTTD